MTGTERRGRRALVIGGGIGGPVAAMALQKAGIESTVFEAHQGSAEFVGSFLNAASNGVDALKAIDAHRDVLTHGFATPRMVMWSGSGKRLGEVANGIQDPDGTGSITIERGRLHGALRRQAIARGIAIVEGKRLVAADRSANGVTAHFADKTSAHADVLIGADGLHSQTRRIIDPAAPSPRFTGQLSLGGFARGTTLTPTPNVFHMMFGRRAFFGYSVHDRGDVYWFANIAWSRDPGPETLRGIRPAEWKARLLALFAHDAGPACDVIRATADELAAYPVYDIAAVPTWHRDLMMIIGDAAHATSPSSGQGASLAIEDAIVLAKCLRDAADVSQAFATYERLRRARVERVVAYSARITQTKTPGAFGRWIRDLVTPLALRVFAGPSAQAWLYDYNIDWNEPAV